MIRTVTARRVTADLVLDEYGDGHPLLLLHGGAGPASVRGFGQRLAATCVARVLVPTHPGFDGTPRPEAVADVGTLAELYLELLVVLDLRDVTVVGSSIGGWIAAEIAIRASARADRRVGSLVLIDAVGIAANDHPMPDFFALTPDELARLAYHEPDRFRVDPASLSEAQRATRAGDRAALAVYSGTHAMTDPSLAARLAAVTVPTLVLWGESDGIVTPGYGQAYANAIPGARFRVLSGAGHLPQLETPEQTLEAVWGFAAAQATSPPEDRRR